VCVGITSARRELNDGFVEAGEWAASHVVKYSEGGYRGERKAATDFTRMNTDQRFKQFRVQP
jgi:hypothetical protein